MLNVKFSCEIKKDIFGKPEQTVSDYRRSRAARRQRWQSWVRLVVAARASAQIEVFQELIGRILTCREP